MPDSIALSSRGQKEVGGRRNTQRCAVMLGEVVAVKAELVCHLEHREPLLIELGQGELAVVVYPIEDAGLDRVEQPRPERGWGKAQHPEVCRDARRGGSSKSRARLPSRAS